jgi:hypothetical protein
VFLVHHLVHHVLVLVHLVYLVHCVLVLVRDVPLVLVLVCV